MGGRCTWGVAGEGRSSAVAIGAQGRPHCLAEGALRAFLEPPRRRPDTFEEFDLSLEDF
ncbi:MAG TPA: hypothetical protein HPP77_04190 [Candidatus Hydrogenedentes bacterium]|nr:hypothetical protein [Candidatus Hydrogenedentota bacterium]HIJ73426.1 hypothetical protein [Candidatus Hydrogenedentota bacterium]